MAKNVFVLMPFSSEFDAAYRLFIKPALEDVGFKITRADDLLNQRNIMHDIVSGIAVADLVVADLTGSNPNVFYELGVAHAFEKPTILLTQSVEELPFDLRSYRVLVYQTHFAKIEDARNELARLAKGAYEGTALFGNPVTDFRSRSPQHSSGLSTQLKTETYVEEVDDRGLIDHIIDMEEGYGEIVGLISRSTKAVAELTPRTTELAENITKAGETGGTLAASQIRFLCQGYASEMDAYTSELRQVNDQYELVAGRIQDSLELVVLSQQESADSNSENLENFLSILNSSRESAAGARDAYVSARASIDSNLNFERNLRRSARAAMAEIERLIDNFSKTISSIDRAIEAATGKLAKVEKGNAAS